VIADRKHANLSKPVRPDFNVGFQQRLGRIREIQSSLDQCSLSLVRIPIKSLELEILNDPHAACLQNLFGLAAP